MSMRVGSWLIVLALTAPIAARAQSGNDVLEKLDALAKQLSEQQVQIARQQEEIERLKVLLGERGTVSKAVVTELVKTEVETTVNQKIASEGLAQVKDSGSQITLPKHIDGLKLKGDLRLRYEMRDADETTASMVNDTDRDRMRTRFRLGGLWTNRDESWEVGVGAATGTAAATSTNDTWSDAGPFDTGDLRLDYAYAKHNLSDYNLTVTLGQQVNPFETSWLLWDADARPAGATLSAAGDCLFSTLGVYDVIQYGTNMGGLYAGQVGMRSSRETANFMLAVSQYYFTDDARKGLPTGLPPGVGLGGSYGFNVTDIHASASSLAGNVRIGVYSDVFKNWGASGAPGTGQQAGMLEPDEENIGYLVGATAQYGRLQLGYAYARVEADAWPVALKDQDMGGGSPLTTSTDVAGHRLQLSYQVTAYFSLGAKADLVRRLHGVGTEADLYQLDMNYKF